MNDNENVQRLLDSLQNLMEHSERCKAATDSSASAAARPRGGHRQPLSVTEFNQLMQTSASMARTGGNSSGGTISSDSSDSDQPNSAERDLHSADAAASSSDHESRQAPMIYYTIDYLIELIKETPYLYDKSHRFFSDLRTRSARWSEIGSKFGLSGPAVHKKWTFIRDRYKRTLNVFLLRRTRGEPFNPLWRFFDTLHEMLGHIYLSPAQQRHFVYPNGRAGTSDSAVSENQRSTPTLSQTSSVLTISFADAAELHDVALRMVAVDLTAGRYAAAERTESFDSAGPSDSVVRSSYIDDSLDDGPPQGVLRDCKAHVALPLKRSASAMDGNPDGLLSTKNNNIDTLLPGAGDYNSKTSNTSTDDDDDNNNDEDVTDNTGSSYMQDFQDRINSHLRKHDITMQRQLINVIHRVIVECERELSRD